MRTRSSTKKTVRTLDQGFEEQRRLVSADLRGSVTTGDEHFPCSLYHHLASESVIDDFLRKSRFYSLAPRRWRLPRTRAKLLDDDFYTPFSNMFSSILKYFWKEAFVQGTRKVVDTHAASLTHMGTNSAEYTSSPSFVIKAVGPSFWLQSSGTRPGNGEIGFSNITSCIDIEMKEKGMSESEQLARVAIYARQIFTQQPNRRFVRLLTLSSEHFRLFHFDRSGLQHSSPINFHDNPHTFVRIILGLTSPNEQDIGLDSSIQWVIKNGKKVSGTLSTRGADGQEVVYPLTNVEPFFFRGMIRGRATICWRVRDPVTGEELVVKDSWRDDDRVSEHVYLQEALGIPGVVQMVSCEPDRAQTKKLRGLDAVTPAGFENRIETRVVMKSYGLSVKFFKSALQVVCALRDAIAGDRGILIDFDMATRRDGGTTIDWRVGTPFYHSIAVLRGNRYRDPLPRDHLDDLEAFYYVLAQIIFGHDSSGTSHPLIHPLTKWEAEDSLLASTLKEAVFTWAFLPPVVSERWPAPCCNLIIAFGTFLRPLVERKNTINEYPSEERKHLDLGWDMLTKVEEHYTHVLELFDKAIEMLGRPESEWKIEYGFDFGLSSYLESSSASSSSSHEGNPVPALSPSPHSQKSVHPEDRSRASSKRRSDGDPDGEPAAKRINSPRTPRIAPRPIAPPPIHTPRRVSRASSESL
ncbi:hypothetical protein MD484_g277, partial [Candolleomyces efflorescens]